MRLKNTSYWPIMVIAFFIFSCTTQDDAMIKKDISVSEVQTFYQELHATKSNGRQTNDLTILWDEAQYKDVATGDALVFPIETSVRKYVRSEGTTTAYPLENRAQALAYRSDDGRLLLDYVQVIPTAHTELFTGYVSVSDWNGEPKHLFRYEDGQFIDNQNNGRSEDLYCYWIDTQTCTVVTSGGFDYKECENSSTLHCHTIDIPPTIAPGDFADPSGGGGPGRGDGSIELCPHPTIRGEFVECETQNSCEAALAARYPSEASEMLRNKSKAESKTNELFPWKKIGDQLNDCGDAFRHAYFNMLNTKAVGPVITREFGVAHECKSASKLQTRMDLYNNEMGILTAIDYPGRTEEELIQILLDKLYSGKLRVLSNLGPKNQETPFSTLIRSSICKD